MRTHLDWRNDVYRILGKEPITKKPTVKIKVETDDHGDYEKNKLQSKLDKKDTEIAALKKVIQTLKNGKRR